MRWWPRREACRCVADGELCPAAAWSGLVCVACCMREAESALRCRCTDEARCAARMSVVMGLGLERTPTWSSCGRGGAYFARPITQLTRRLSMAGIVRRRVSVCVRNRNPQTQYINTHVNTLGILDKTALSHVSGSILGLGSPTVWPRARYRRIAHARRTPIAIQ